MNLDPLFRKTRQLKWVGNVSLLVSFCALLSCQPPSQPVGETASTAAAEKATSGTSVEKHAVVPFGTVHKLNSQVLGEERVLNVYIPPHFTERPDMLFPVIVLLDGATHEDYLHITGLVQFLALYELMPPSIVVGVANVDRYRDFTFPSTREEDLERLPTSGGSEKFRKFLELELKPYIEAKLPSSGSYTLIGQSLGGLLATEVFMTSPNLFNNYFIVSPSLWWDGGSLQTKIPEAVKNFSQGSAVVYLALGEEGPEMQAGVDAFIAALKSEAPTGLTWYYESFPEETHATVLHRAVYKGFERLYEKTHQGM